MLNLLTVTWDVNPFILTGILLLIWSARKGGPDVNPFILTGILLLIWSARKGGPARIQNNTVRHGANQQH